MQERTLKRGTVTTTLDFNNNDRPLKRVTEVGNGMKKTEDFAYDEDGSTTVTTTNPDGSTEIKQTKVEDGKTKETITRTENGQTHTIETIDGTEVRRVTKGADETTEVTVGAEGVRTKTVRTSSGVQSKVHIDADGNAVAEKYSIQNGDTWYGIVEAKYGIKDPKQIMEIVHQLKSSAGVSRSATTMPSEITLPPSVKLKNGSAISLQNIDAVSDSRHLTGGKKLSNYQKQNKPLAESKIEIPAFSSFNFPDRPTGPLPADEMHAEVPNFPVVKENAGKTVQGSDGKYYKYDDDGRVTDVYDSEDDMKAGRESFGVFYSEDGTIDNIYRMSYNSSGRTTSFLAYDENGTFTECSMYSYDEVNGQRLETVYSKDGTIEKYIIAVGENVSETYDSGYSNYRYKPSGEIISASIYTNDGNFNVDYDANGFCEGVYDVHNDFQTVYKRK